MTPCTMNEVDLRARILDAVRAVQRGPRTTEAVVRETGYTREYVVAVLTELATPQGCERRTHVRGIIELVKDEWKVTVAGYGKPKQGG